MTPRAAILPISDGLPDKALRTIGDLGAAGLTDAADAGALARVAERYAIAITPAMAALIDTSDPDDPIARQFVPDKRELDALPQELNDPIGDEAHSPVPGIVHRYTDRVLLKITHVCPVYCRFCFRREMVGPANGEALSAAQLEAALDYVRAHDEVREVIVTGGDPFVLSPRRIAQVTAALGTIAHVDILRWHTRVPVVAPERMTQALVTALAAPGKSVVVALHCNHPRELTEAARAAVTLMAQAGIALLSQTVLLKGLNDDAGTLEALVRDFAVLGIAPYYLHHGDLAPGTSHFRTTIAQGRALMDELGRRLPASILPRYVLDIPGGHGKVDIEAHVHDAGNGTYTVRDPNGGMHTYNDRSAR